MVNDNLRDEVIKNKVKLVAKGFLQKAGIDYGKVYALVARIETIRLLIYALAGCEICLSQWSTRRRSLYGSAVGHQEPETRELMATNLRLA
ncbi:hypothetical protein CR513_56445, partial [Mucuna pruriens]